MAASGILLAAGLAWQWFQWQPSAGVTILLALATAGAGLLVFPAAWKALRQGRLDMNVLMSIAALGAWAIGAGEEAASVVFLFALSELLESWSAGRARRAISSLLELSPETALRIREGDDMKELPVGEISVGDAIFIRSGSRVPLDGEVIRGTSSVNQAPITGESVPVEKAPGDGVYAGTINGEGSLTVRVTQTADHSTLARIIRLVEKAEEQKAPTQRFVDRFARVYTPAVFAAALLLAVTAPLLLGQPWEVWIYRALVLLVIACPCALVIATPVSIVSGLTALTRRGVLIKGGTFLETVGRLRALAVDKTGTITEGKPSVVEVIAMPGSRADDVLAIAASIDAHSEHPMAKAVVEEAKRRGIAFSPAEKYVSRTGRGVEGSVEGRVCFVGNHRMAHELGACTPELESRLQEIESRGLSLAIVGSSPSGGRGGNVLGVMAMGDRIRPEVRLTIAALHRAGVQSVVMLSGDHQRTVDAIAREAGIDRAIGDLLPQDKVEHIRALVQEHRYVGMIGDGVNDAPALATASVGIAMGAIGSDTAIETADMALMQDDLSKVLEAIATGRRTLRVIQFNVAFALIVKALFLVLAFFGYTSLWMAILADTGATLLVILNALRLLRSGRSGAPPDKAGSR